jgi:hypothetical protein
MYVLDAKLQIFIRMLALGKIYRLAYFLCPPDILQYFLYRALEMTLLNVFLILFEDPILLS